MRGGMRDEGHRDRGRAALFIGIFFFFGEVGSHSQDFEVGRVLTIPFHGMEILSSSK